MTTNFSDSKLPHTLNLMHIQVFSIVINHTSQVLFTHRYTHSLLQVCIIIMKQTHYNNLLFQLAPLGDLTIHRFSWTRLNALLSYVYVVLPNPFTSIMLYSCLYTKVCFQSWLNLAALSMSTYSAIIIVLCCVLLTFINNHHCYCN